LGRCAAACAAPEPRPRRAAAQPDLENGDKGALAAPASPWLQHAPRRVASDAAHRTQSCCRPPRWTGYVRAASRMRRACVCARLTHIPLCAASLHVEFPMLFEIANLREGRVSHCGVLEFVAEEGVVYLPYWVRVTRGFACAARLLLLRRARPSQHAQMMQNLLLQEGDIVKLKSTSLPKGTYVKLRPQSKDFLDITNPKAVLETTLRKYSCLTTGDSILINYNNKRYYIDIFETKPQRAVTIIEVRLCARAALPRVSHAWRLRVTPAPPRRRRTARWTLRRRWIM
jgi:hypothetical protein